MTSTVYDPTTTSLENSNRKISTIIVVDDHPLVRERLVELIVREPDLEVCGEAEDRHEALEIIASTRADLAIIDLTLKSSLGIDLIKDLQIRQPEVLWVDVIVDVDGVRTRVAPQLLDMLSLHPRPSEVRGEPMTTAMRGEVVLQSF